MSSSNDNSNVVETELQIPLLHHQHPINDNNNSSSTTKDDYFAVQATLIVDCRCLLGECIVYDDVRNAVVWTDIYGASLHELVLSAQPRQSALHRVHQNLPRQLCSFGLVSAAPARRRQQEVASGGGKNACWPLLCAWSDGFQLYDVANRAELSPYSQGAAPVPPAAAASSAARLNDGRTDRTNRRFVCGGYHGDDETTTMKVFQVVQDPETLQLRHRVIVDEIRVTNSICWSPDGATLYLADSPTRQICRYDYDRDTGMVRNPRRLHTTGNRPPADEGDGGAVPDGSCVDADGYLWNAVWRGSAVHRIHPETGQIAYAVHVPGASQVTCCCFGGPDLDVLFVTTAREGIVGSEAGGEERHAGGVFAVKLPFRGVKENRLEFVVGCSINNTN